MNNTKLLKIKDLIFDERFYPRGSIDEKTVTTYIAALETEAKFPPIHVGLFEGKNIIVDGWHRATARQRLGIEFIDAEVKSYVSEKELFTDAVKYNIDHGLALSDQDKQLVTNKLLTYQFTINEISLLVHLPKTVIEKPKSFSVTSPCGKKMDFKHEPEKPNFAKAPDTRNYEPEHIIDVENQIKWLINLIEQKDKALQNIKVKELIKKLQSLLRLGEV